MRVNSASFKASVSESAKNLPKNSIKYVKSLFPFLSWITRYNLDWFTHDLIAGVTVGMLVIPQVCYR